MILLVQGRVLPAAGQSGPYCALSSPEWMEGSLRGERQGGCVRGWGGERKLHLCLSVSSEGVRGRWEGRGRGGDGDVLPSGTGTCWLHRQEREKEARRKWLKDAVQ